VNARSLNLPAMSRTQPNTCCWRRIRFQTST